MFVFLVCLVLAASQCDAGGYIGTSLYGLDTTGLYNNYHGAYASSYTNYKPYAFEYGVSDPHTGDHKSQWETKDEHGTVRGSYSLLEPDGSTRIVDYIADDHGFRAVVKKIGIHGHAVSVESHGGVDAGPKLVNNPIIVSEPEHSIGLAGPIAYQTPIALPVPTHVEQPLIVKQDPIVHQQAVYVEQGPAFQSYDGGVHNYQNLVPVPKAQGIFAPEPVINTHIPHSFVQEPLIAPKAPGIITEHSYSAPQASYQPIYQGPQIKSYQNVPQQQFTAYEQSLPATQYIKPAYYEKESPIPYHGPNYNEKVALPAYQEQRPIYNEKVALPSYDNHAPVSSYQFEQSFGEPHNLVAAQPKYIVSSQNYIGREGNIQHEGDYNNLGGYNGQVAYENAGHNEPVQYNQQYKRNSN